MSYSSINDFCRNCGKSLSNYNLKINIDKDNKKRNYSCRSCGHTMFTEINHEGVFISEKIYNWAKEDGVIT